MKRNFPTTQTCLPSSQPCSGKYPERLFFSIKAAGTALLLSIFLFAGASLNAATITSAATGNWSAGATWVGGIAPVAGDDVIIASGHTVTLTAAVDITTGSLTVTGTLALAGFDLTAGSLSGAGNIGSASGTPLVTVGSNGSSTTYSGIFSGTGARLTKDGSGTLTLTGASIFTGNSTISADILITNNATALGASALVTVSGAGTLQTNASLTLKRLTISATTAKMNCNGQKSSCGQLILRTPKL